MVGLKMHGDPELDDWDGASEKIQTLRIVIDKQDRQIKKAEKVMSDMGYMLQKIQRKVGLHQSIEDVLKLYRTYRMTYKN